MNEERVNQIERFLDGEMTEQERLAFEQEMGTDSDLREEVMFQKELKEALQEDDVKDLEEKLHRIMEADQPSSPIIRRISWQAWAVAAAVVILVGLGYLLIPSEPQVFDYTDVLAEAGFPDSLEPEDGLRSIDQPPTQQQGIDQVFATTDSLYQLGEAGAALDTLRSLGPQIPELSGFVRNRYAYYEGILLLNTGQIDQGITVLNTITEGRMFEPAAWYKTLAMLQSVGATQEVIDLLETLSQYNNPYRPEATELLEMISAD